MMPQPISLSTGTGGCWEEWMRAEAKALYRLYPWAFERRRNQKQAPGPRLLSDVFIVFQGRTESRQPAHAAAPDSAREQQNENSEDIFSPTFLLKHGLMTERRRGNFN